jgi:multidrug efflux system membrane fusion protein
MRRFVKYFVLLLLLGGAAYAVYKRLAPPPEAAAMMAAAGGPPPAMPVNVAKVQIREVQVWNEFSGRLTAVDAADIRPRVSGTIEAVNFKDGAMVSKGDLLFTIDPKPFAAALDQALGALSSAQAQAKLGHTEAERAEGMLKAQAIPRNDYDEKQNAMNVADANVKSAQAAVETARLNLGYTQIKAPISGRAGRAEITVGNLVEAGMGNAPVLTTIVSSDPIYADFEIDEKTYHWIMGAGAPAAGQDVPAQLGLADEKGTPHMGHVQSFDNKVDTASGTIRVRAVFENKDGMMVPGMFARVRMGTPSAQKVLVITDRAVSTDQNKKFVLVVGDDNKVQYREVKLGPPADGGRIVEEGLKEGERIVVSGLQRARPGSTVAPEEVAMDAPEAPPAQAAPAAGEKPAEEKPPAEVPAEEKK